MASPQESSQVEQQSDTSRPPPEGPIYCLNNCGFFGSPQTNNLCSLCYKETLRLAAALSQEVATPHESATSSSIAVPDLQVGSASSSVAPIPPPPEKPNRCFSCHKRVGLTGFKCRCDNVFCSQHWYSDTHNCPFDYKAAAREAISKANPVVKADKIGKI